MRKPHHEDQVTECDHSDCIRQSMDTCSQCNAEVCREHRRYCAECGVVLCEADARSVENDFFCALHIDAAMAEALEAAEAAQAVGAAMETGTMDNYFQLAVGLAKERRAEL